MKNILVISRTFPFPPAHGGDMSYSRGMILSLGKQAKVTALVASNGEVEDGILERGGVTWVIAGQAKRGRIRSLASRLPIIAWRGETKPYKDSLESLLQHNWDAVVIDHIGSAHAIDRIRAYKKRHPGTRIVYWSHEHEASVRKEKYSVYGGNFAMRLAMKLDGAKVSSTEMRLLKNVDLVSVINPEDEKLYKEQVSTLKFVTLTPGYVGSNVEARKIDARIPRRVIVLGGRGSKQKQVILERWLDVASSRLADRGIEMIVVGPIDDDFGRSLAGRYPRTKFLGYVDDLDALLATCRMGIVADFVGGGFKVRLLTYVFHRVPMVAVSGAVSGLGVSRAAYGEAADLESLVQLISERIDDFDYLNNLQDQAYSACVGRFSWDDRGADLVEALCQPC